MFEAQAYMNGARLAYVVRKIPGNPVKRPVCKIGKKGEGIKFEEKDQPPGFMVYFPRGHTLRIPNEKLLAHYGLKIGKATIVNMEGLLDSNSPLGKVMLAQNDEARATAMVDMERMVMQLATAKTGPVLMPEQVREIV